MITSARDPSSIAKSRLQMISEAEALRGIEEAGDDVEKLVGSISVAEFLADLPGENRQKLRAAKARLRALKLKAGKENEGGAEKKSKTQPGLDLKNSLEDLDKEDPKKEYNYERFEKLSEHFKELKWRKIQLPGGATRHPEEFYVLYALSMQAKVGDNKSEEPMWAETGGLDFEGRLQWAAWNTRKGSDSSWCKKKFVQAYFEMSKTVLYMDNRLKSEG